MLNYIKRRIKTKIENYIDSILLDKIDEYSDVYFVKTGPKCDKRKVSVEPDAKWIWRDDRWDQEPFSRHYSPEAFKTRILDNIHGMTSEILYFTNLDELRKYYNGNRIYCNFMFRAFK